MTDDRFLLKNFFDETTVGIIADAVAGAEATFDRTWFLTAVFDEQWDERELKQRMRHVTVCLHDALSADYPTAVGILIDVVRKRGLNLPVPHQ